MSLKEVDVSRAGATRRRDERRSSSRCICGLLSVGRKYSRGHDDREEQIFDKRDGDLMLRGKVGKTFKMSSTMIPRTFSSLAYVFANSSRRLFPSARLRSIGIFADRETCLSFLRARAP